MFPITCSSFGDIVAAADLALTIVRALSDSSGSSHEYQYLIEELRSLSQALSSAAFAVRSIQPSDDITTNIASEIGRCYSVMNKFHDRIQKYQKALGSGGSGNSWRKIGWALFKPEEVKDLRNKLSIHRATIQVFLASIVCTTLANQSREAKQRETSFTVMLNEIHTAVRRLPRTVGYTDENGVRLVDVLGRSILLPMLICSTWEQFDATLKVAFAGRAGERYVKRGHYEISGDSGKQIIRPETWTNTVKAGVLLDMSIVMWQAHRPFDRCPRCNNTIPHSSGCQAWIECPHCGGWYQVSDMSEQAQLPPTWTQEADDIHENYHDQGNLEYHGVRDRALFHRVHIMKHLAVPSCVYCEFGAAPEPHEYDEDEDTCYC